MHRQRCEDNRSSMSITQTILVNFYKSFMFYHYVSHSATSLITLLFTKFKNSDGVTLKCFLKTVVK